MSLLQNKAVHGAGGFLLMGAWAVYANRDFDMPAPLIAGLVQGMITAGITLVLKRCVEMIYARSDGGLRFVLPPVTAFATSLIILTVLHGFAGTPALLATISVPLCVSTIYALLYVLTLDRHAR